MHSPTQRGDGIVHSPTQRKLSLPVATSVALDSVGLGSVSALVEFER